VEFATIAIVLEYARQPRFGDWLIDCVDPSLDVGVCDVGRRHLSAGRHIPGGNDDEGDKGQADNGNNADLAVHDTSPGCLSACRIRSSISASSSSSRLSSRMCNRDLFDHVADVVELEAAPERASAGA
jgi:hypothetical protein